jgi:2-polyprenyl-3-methyl-5-hydroxy-6-metoxy-1,4-benzoquinol methylase
MPVDIAAISSGVKLAADGIWYSADMERVSYPDTGHEAAFAVEESSFWFRHRNDCIAEVARQFPPAAGGAIFDIGGGNGYVTRGLINAGFNAVLVEPGPAGANNARRRGLENVICATSDAARFNESSLSAVGLFDVIEHVDNDLAFLRSIRLIMRDDGMLYATVPAYQSLWSDEDEDAGHFRRHTIASISRVVEAAGFEVAFASYIFRFLPLPILLLRALPYRLGIKRQHATSQAAARDHATSGGPASRILESLLRSELHVLSAKREMRFGGSILIAARARK